MNLDIKTSERVEVNIPHPKHNLQLNLTFYGIEEFLMWEPILKLLTAANLKTRNEESLADVFKPLIREAIGAGMEIQHDYVAGRYSADAAIVMADKVAGEYAEKLAKGDLE